MNPFYDALIGETLMDPVPEQPGWFDLPTSMLPAAGRHELAADDTQQLPVVDPTEPPADDADAGLGGQLSTVTDEEWRAAHEQLIAEHPELADQLTYVWAPDLDGRTLIDPSEREIAPADGHYPPPTAGDAGG